MKTLISNFREMLEVGGDLQVAERLGDDARVKRLREQYAECHRYADQLAANARRGRATESNSGRVVEAVANKTFSGYAADERKFSRYHEVFGSKR